MSNMRERVNRVFYDLVNADAEDYKPSFIKAIATLLDAAVDEERDACAGCCDIEYSKTAEQKSSFAHGYNLACEEIRVAIGNRRTEGER